MLSAMSAPPWDQQIARVLVGPLVRTPVTPNQMTALFAAVALAGAALCAFGDPVLANWGAGVFVLGRFLDHLDGELARQKNMRSQLGYYLDYLAGAVSYAALFICLGIGFSATVLGVWSIVLGLLGASAALVSMALNLRIDRALGTDGGAEADFVGYPSIAGFELEDGIYLLAPITWLGWLLPFFIAAGIGAGLYTLWTLATMLRLRRSGTLAQPPHEVEREQGRADRRGDEQLLG